jgi:hypothetical protein
LVKHGFWIRVCGAKRIIKHVWLLRKR